MTQPCAPCTPNAVNLDTAGRLWWMATFSLADHQPDCPNIGAPTLAKSRFAWLMLQALRAPRHRLTEPMPGDPQPEFWPACGCPAPAPRRQFAGPSPYQRIKSVISIQDVCGLLGVELRQFGRTEKGRCPLHDDRSPSFVVYPDDDNGAGRFYCFGCNQGGDVIDLLEMTGKLPQFKDAAR